METNKSNEYIPSAPVHPFDIVEDEIAARGLTKKEFSASIGMKPSNFSRMMKTKGEMTSEMALKLEAALDIPYSHWMRYYEAYLKDCVRLNVSPIGDTRSSHKENRHEDLYNKLFSTLLPIRERIESINVMLSTHRMDSSDNLTMEQITSIENDIHRLGRELCKLRLT